MSTSSGSRNTPAAWGAPLQRLDQLWTAAEQRVAVWVIIAEIITLVLWVSLKGLASVYNESNIIGLVFRSMLTSILLGLIAHLITRPRGAAAKASAKDLSLSSRTNTIAVTAAVFIGLFLGRVWVTVGTEWCSNVVEWLQNASTFALIGGPRGMVTRLTLALALLGASMAASRGKHINIDLATRYVPPRFAAPVAIVGWVAAALVCFAAAWGFTDSIAVTKFKAEAFRSCPAGTGGSGGAGGATELCDTPAGERIGVAAKGVASDFFLFRRQVALDFHTIPHVLAGDAYDKYLSVPEWNAWVKQGGWEAYFPPEAIATILLPADDPTEMKMPAITEPGTGEGRDLLIRDLNFVLPIGLFVIGLKFLLRVLRALSGHVKVDPNAAHEDEDLKHAHDHDKDVEEAEADVLGTPAAHASAGPGGAS